MSTSAKTCPPKNIKKKSKYKLASPISNDRAEAFVGPQADVCPRLTEIPSERDAKAFLLASQGMTQREIAKELKTSQPTVQRTLRKYRGWFGSTLPEDRGELIGFPRFRVAVEERRILLRHQIEMAMEEWQQSRQPMPMKRTRTKIYPEGRKAGGAEVKEVQIDEYVQRRNPSASHLNAAAKRSLELTMLEAGYLGVRQLSCDEAIDVDERDRWDRIVKSHQKTNEELTRKVAELEAKLADNSRRVHEAKRNARVEGEASVENQFESNANPACISQSLMHPTPTTLDESRMAESTPSVNQNPPAPEIASLIQPASSGEAPDASPPICEKVNQESRRVHEAERNARVEGEVAAANQPEGNANPACISQSLMHPTPEPKYRWEDSFRQEALDYHCLKFGLPPATTDMATGIPDPFKMSPRLWMERGFPYQIYIDRDIPCDRKNPLDTMGVIKLACHPVVNPEGW